MKLYKLLAWIIGIFLAVQFLMGSTVTVVYNGEKAKKTFWSGALVIANRIGDFKNAIWR